MTEECQAMLERAAAAAGDARKIDAGPAAQSGNAAAMAYQVWAKQDATYYDVLIRGANGPVSVTEHPAPHTASYRGAEKSPPDPKQTQCLLARDEAKPLLDAIKKRLAEYAGGG